MKTGYVNSHSTRVALNSSKRVKSKLDKNSERLSTAKRVNKAGDDAAGLAIASKVNAQVRSSQTALRNANQAISFVHYAEQSLSTIHDIMVRLQEITIANASDTLGWKERDMNNVEFMQLKDEIRRVVSGTKYYERKVLNGSIKEMSIQVGTKASKSDVIKVNTEMFSATLDALGIHDIDASTKQRARKTLRKFRYAVEETSRARTYYGTLAKVLSSAVRNLDTSIENNTAAYGRMMDADYAKETSERVKNNLVRNSATSVISQANEGTRSAARLVENGGVPRKKY